MTQDFDDRGDDGVSRPYRYRYDPSFDPTGGQVSGLSGHRRSQGRDHVRQLDSFYHQGLIADVLYLVRIGKEASVYCCRGGEFLSARLAVNSVRRPEELDLRRLAQPSGDDGEAEPLIAAKVYRARQYRFKNDAVYQEDRTRGMKGQAARALAKKTDFGRDVQTGSWVGHEFGALKELYEAGCDVPKPLIADADSILMEYIGDENGPAPQLNRVDLNREDAEAQFERTMTNIEILLACNRVHGDLSPHNILYWDGHVVLIDFPQAVDARFNSQAERLLHRDVDNVCRYFNQYGLGADAWAVANDLWQRWKHAEL
ncbi:MAG TPA: RIO1 family regulatory kinase/ATPase [Dehalococcoidia bacterium]